MVLLLDGLGCEECKVLRYEKYCLVLAECNSFVNPIIYSLRDKDMRTTFLEILCCGSRQNKNNSTSAAHFNTIDQEVLAEIIRRETSPADSRSLHLSCNSSALEMSHHKFQSDPTHTHTCARNMAAAAAIISLLTSHK